MADLKTQVIISAKDETQRVFANVRSSLSSMNGLIASFGLGLSAAGLVGAVKSTADFADQMGKAAQKVGVGETVTLWGGEGNMYLAADDVATAAGTVAYELFCALAARVPVIDVN